MADTKIANGDRIARSKGLFAALLPAHAGQALTISLVAPVVPMIAAYLGGGKSGDFSAQLVSVVPFLGILVGGMISGLVMKAIGLRTFVLVAAVLFGIGGVIGLTATTLFFLLAGSLVLGFAAIFVLTGLSSLTSIAYNGAERGKIIGLQAGIAGLSNIIFGLSAAFIAERLGWRVPFAVLLGFGAIVLTLTLLYVPPAPPEEEEPIAIGAIAKRIWPLMLVAGMAFMVIVSQSTQLPFLMADKGLVSSGSRGIVLTTLAAASMLGSIGYGLFQAHINERVLLFAIGVLGIVGWGLFGFWTGGLALAILGAALMGLAQGLLIPRLFGGVMRAVPDEAGGPAIGLLNVAICCGSFLNPLLSSPVRSVTGLDGLMFVLAGMSALIMIVSISWGRIDRARLQPLAG